MVKCWKSDVDGWLDDWLSDVGGWWLDIRCWILKVGEQQMSSKLCGRDVKISYAIMNADQD